MNDLRSGGLQRVRAGDLEVAYRFDGPYNVQIVLMTHSVLTDHRMWDALAERLVGRFAVLRYDLRGHGATAPTAAPYTMAQLADDAVALLDALSIEQVHFIGSSLGGMIGQQLGARHGRRLTSLTLANTTAVQRAPAIWQERIATARRDGVAALAEGTLQRWFTPTFFESSPSEIARIRQLLLGTSMEGFVGCAEAIARLTQLNLLHAIRVPTLVLAGAEDHATPLEQSAQLHAGIYGARLVTLTNAAHQSAVEQPAAFYDAWLEFLHETVASSDFIGSQK